MKKGNIILVEATSTAVNYIHDVRELGYNPICLELYQKEEDRPMQRALHDLQYSLNNEKPPEIMPADISYEKTLEMVKELDPVVIIPGSDNGLEWATRLAYDLGLPGNDPKNLRKMKDKKCMQEALKKRNLRYIRSKEVNSFEEAKEFISELDDSTFVVKPSIGQSTIGVCICKTDEELKDALELNFALSAKDENIKPIIQEYIGGEEYFLDTLCCRGYNRVTGAFRYQKNLIEGRGAIYDYIESIDTDHEIYDELEKYNNDVISAIGIDYGIAHIEYKIDEKGPVLIEVNCRVPGPLQKYNIQDLAWGEHSTGASLESYLNPEKCIAEYDRPLERLNPYIIKTIIIDEDIKVKKSHVEEIFKDLESYQFAISFGDDRIYPKTVDLSTCGGLIFLINKDETKLMEDVATIQRMEHNEIDKIFDIED